MGADAIVRSRVWKVALEERENARARAPVQFVRELKENAATAKVQGALQICPLSLLNETAMSEICDMKGALRLTALFFKGGSI
jgi:hypothetical protein